jgi:hypothetical protein
MLKFICSKKRDHSEISGAFFYDKNVTSKKILFPFATHFGKSSFSKEIGSETICLNSIFLHSLPFPLTSILEIDRYLALFPFF